MIIDLNEALSRIELFEHCRCRYSSRVNGINPVSDCKNCKGTGDKPTAFAQELMKLIEFSNR